MESANPSRTSKGKEHDVKLMDRAVIVACVDIPSSDKEKSPSIDLDMRNEMASDPRYSKKRFNERHLNSESHIITNPEDRPVSKSLSDDSLSINAPTNDQDVIEGKRNTCNQCHGTGHWARHCISLPASCFSNPPPRCYCCRGMGHYSKFCPSITRHLNVISDRAEYRHLVDDSYPRSIYNQPCPVPNACFLRSRAYSQPYEPFISPLYAIPETDEPYSSCAASASPTELPSIKEDNLVDHVSHPCQTESAVPNVPSWNRPPYPIWYETPLSQHPYYYYHYYHQHYYHHSHPHHGYYQPTMQSQDACPYASSDIVNTDAEAPDQCEMSSDPGNQTV